MIGFSEFIFRMLFFFSSLTVVLSGVSMVLIKRLNIFSICGGYDGVTSLSTVECYCPKTDSWSTVAPMMKYRSAGGVAALGKYVYALGGHDGLSIFDSVEKYDSVSNTWTKVSPMLNRRCRLGVATLNDKLYACGGYDGNSFLKRFVISFASSD